MRSYLLRVTALLLSTAALVIAGADLASSASAAPESVGLTITSAPKGVVSRHFATFRFTAEPDADDFTCKLDNKPRRSCSSPVTFRHLKSGTHHLQISASIRREDGGESADVLLRWTVRQADVRR